MEHHQLGTQIATLRKRRGMSQEELANQLGVTRQAISNWERGMTQPDLEMLMKLAAIFETDLDGLIGIKSDIKEEPVELNLKPLKWMYLTQFFSLIGYFVFVVLSPRYEVSGILIILLTFLMMATSIYFVFTHGIKTGDYTLVAGYDKRVHYHDSSLKKMAYITEFYCVFTTLSYSLIYIILSLMKLEISWLFMLLIVIFMIQFIGGILLINVKYCKEIFVEPSEQEEARVGMWIVLVFVSSIMIMVIATIVTQLAFNISNNTVEAGQLVLFILPYIFLNMVGLFLEQNRVKKAVKEQRAYRPDRMTYLIILACLILLLGMIYTGYQTTLR